MFKIGILLGAGFCGLSVVIGAFVAHALKDKLSDYGVLIFDKALFYQVFHALAILFISILEYNISELSLNVCVILFSFGSGPVKGFAVTLGIGIVTTLFSAYFFARHLSSIYVKRNKDNEVTQ